MANITRNYWEEILQKENMNFVDKLFAQLNQATGLNFIPNYTSSYIGATLDGKNCSILNVRQSKKGIRLSIQVKQTADFDKTLKSLSIDENVNYGTDGWYVLYITNQADLDQLIPVLVQSAIERGFQQGAMAATSPKEKPTPAKAEKSTKAVSEEDALKARIAELEKELKKQKETTKEPAATQTEKSAQKSNDPFEGTMVKVCAGMYVQKFYSQHHYYYKGHYYYPNGDKRKKQEWEPTKRWWGDIKLQSRRVTITKPFNICKYPVTQGQWKQIMGEGFNPSHFRGDDNLPVESVTVEEIFQFIEKLNQLTGKKYRLPTEAEWQWAAVGAAKDDDQGDWAGCSKEEDLDQYAWYSKNSDGKTHPVGKKKPNELGLYDMSGNVWEVCEDKILFDEDRYYPMHNLGTSEVSDPCVTEGNHHVVKGSAFDREAKSDIVHTTCLVYGLGSLSPEGRSLRIGFRLAETIE